MQIATVVLGALLVGLASSPDPSRGRIIAAGLAVSWLSVAVAPAKLLQTMNLTPVKRKKIG